jgi:hypothetical protein
MLHMDVLSLLSVPMSNLRAIAEKMTRRVIPMPHLTLNASIDIELNMDSGRILSHI